MTSRSADIIPLRFEHVSKHNPKTSPIAAPFIGRTYTRQLPYVTIKIFKGVIKHSSAN